MKWPALLAFCVALALPTQTFSQTLTVERQFKGSPNTNINVGIFTTLRKNCTAGPLPVVRLVAPPAHGKITLKQGRLRATNLKQCLGVEVPAFIAIYRSAQNFIGQDLVTLEVIGAGGKSQFQRIRVTITQPGGGQGI